MRISLPLLAGLVTAVFHSVMPQASAQAKKFVPNYDESKIPDYVLPDPLEGVGSAADWPKQRSEIFELIEREMFGRAPEFNEEKIAFDPGPEAFDILDGKAKVSQPILKIAGQNVRLLVVQPAAVETPVPAFIGYNFNGNHTVLSDERVLLANVWSRSDGKAIAASNEDRGKSASRWSVKRIVDAGFALVTIYYGDVDPDFDDGFENGIFARFPKPKPGEWGSIAGWAWSLSRVLDFLGQEDRGIDARKVAVFGHSRLGKTSLWAGAADSRFALVISNNSGCGGAALSKRAVGETVGRINSVFPHWFCDNFLRYNENEAAMAFDSHMLLALIAPRPLYVASAEGDKWADPKGEFLACLAADPVYRLLGTDGLPAKEMPAVNEPSQGRIGYHIRTGKHDVTDYDWQQYIKFAAKNM